MLSNTGLSNLFTMGASAKLDTRQSIPDTYTIPDEATRLLRARLLLEETLETINALGFNVCVTISEPCIIGKDVTAQTTSHEICMDAVEFEPELNPNLEGIIDGCCDVSYVAVGTMLCCGAPDELHMNEVNKANNAKFPNGQAITNEHGKFQKPRGWQPPDHSKHFKHNWMQMLKDNPIMTVE